jgi:hypothetical protein
VRIAVIRKRGSIRVVPGSASAGPCAAAKVHLRDTLLLKQPAGLAYQAEMSAWLK